LAPEDPEPAEKNGAVKELKEVKVISIKGGLWAKTRFYYYVRDLTNGNLSRITNEPLREMMYRMDAISKHRERVSEMTRQSDLVIWGIFLAPIALVEGSFLLAGQGLGALVSEAPLIIEYLGNKAYNKLIQEVLKRIASGIPVRNIKDFENLGKVLKLMEKSRELKKDAKSAMEIKKIIETIIQTPL
jgi:hypothetical protein